MSKLKKLKVESKGLDKKLKFMTRPETSDYKSIREVVEKRGYGRYGFTPQPGERWLDLGVNIGAFSVWAAAHGAMVHGFEPEPDCFALAQTNVELNNLGDLVTLEQAGVWPDSRKKKTNLSINSARGNVWRSSMLKEWRGGTTIEVPLVSAAGLWKPDVCVKMDIEGIEMPILEKLAAKPVQKLVFEWSFDIDPDLNRFRAVIATLEATYENVKGGKVPDEFDEWQPSWFPPCRLVYCW